MILAVSGWRGWTDVSFIHTCLDVQDDMFGLGNIHLRVGCAAGVDKWVRNWVVAKGHLLASCTVYYADWVKLGKAAGMIRNGQMLRGESPLDPNPGQAADRLLAFPQPGVKMRSPGSGTVGCILDAHLLGVSLDIPGYQIQQRREA